MTATPDLAQFRRIVIKVGSALLVDSARGRCAMAGSQRWPRTWPNSTSARADVIVVSSGAIALGPAPCSPAGRSAEAGGQPGGGLRRADRARAALGRSAGHQGITAGQLLLTLGDTEERRRYIKQHRATLQRLLDMRAVPVVNENDTVATTEIRIRRQ